MKIVTKLCKYQLKYRTRYVIIYTYGGEIQMRGESRKKKSNSKIKAWSAELLKDLMVGIILLILEKLLE